MFFSIFAACMVVFAVVRIASDTRDTVQGVGDRISFVAPPEQPTRRSLAAA